MNRPTLSPLIRLFQTKTSPYVVLLCALLAVLVLLWEALDRHLDANLTAQFDLEVQQITLHLSERMQAHEQILRGGAGLFASTDHVTQSQWRRYVERLDLENTYPGIQGVGFARYIPEDKLDAFLKDMAADPLFRFSPEGKRDAYSSIVFLEPFTGRNLRAYGFDMFAEPVRRAAMLRARDTGEPAYSDKVRLVQETDEDIQHGMLIYFPVYADYQTRNTKDRQNALIGWVYSPFRMKDLITNVLGRDLGGIRLKIYDQPNLTPETLLFDSQSEVYPPVSVSGLEKTIPLKLHGKTWTLRYSALPSFEARHAGFENALPKLALALIGIISMGLVYAQIAGRKRSAKETRELAAHLHDSDEQFRVMVDSVHDYAIIRLDVQGNIVSWNQGAQRIKGWQADEIIGRNIAQFYTEEDRRQDVPQKGMATAIVAGHCEMVGWRVRKDGSLFWASVIITPLYDEEGALQGFVKITRDISSQKQFMDALEAQSQKLQGLFHLSPLGIVLAESNGNIIEYNQSFAVMVGGEEYLPHLNLWQFLDLSSIEVEMGPNRILRQSGKFGPIELNGVVPGGGSIPVRVNASLIHDPLGRETIWVMIEDIHLSREASLALEKSLVEFNSLVSRIPLGIYKYRMSLNGEEGFEYVSPRFCEQLGLEANDILQDKDLVFDLVLKEDLPSLAARNAQARLTRGPFSWEGRYQVGPSVRWFYIESRCTSLENGDLLWDGFQQEITERKLAEEKLYLSSAVFNSTQEGIAITDAMGIVLTVNPAFTHITEYEEAEIVGKSLKLLSSGKHDARFFHQMYAQLKECGYWQSEIWNRRKNGEVHPEWLTINAVTSPEGRVLQYVAVFTDISRIRHSETHLEHLAHHDALTNLPNRLLLQSRLTHTLERARRDNRTCAVLFIDLDRFKWVNDQLGHQAGDELLKIVATRLHERVRENDTLARLGGDEFVAVLEHISTPQEAAIVAEAMIKQLTTPFILQGVVEANIGGSIGISLFPHHGHDAATLIRKADEAMYQAKSAGRGCWMIYQPEASGLIEKKV